MHNTIDECLAVLIPWNEAYRNGKPIVTDAQYDVVWDILERKVEHKRRHGHAQGADVSRGIVFLNQIGALPPGTSGWPKVTHGEPMLSLNKARTITELSDWFDKYATLRVPSKVAVLFILSVKLDGISIRLNYKDGYLVSAVTRGGNDPMTGQQVGEDITKNVIQMRGVKVFLTDPSHGPVTGWIRAEIVLSKSVWKAALPEYDNTRNASAGIAKDEKGGAKCKYLSVICYQINDGKTREKLWEMRTMRRMGLLVASYFTADSLQEMETIFDGFVTTDRDALDFDIDGLVIEHNDPEIIDTIGVHGRGPDGAIALKFPADSQKTILRDIIWQVGGTGRVTPVASFDAVKLAGVMVRRASFHNLDLMDTLLADSGLLSFWSGDTLLVSRRGDVIPYIEEHVSRGVNGVHLPTPKLCPSCNQPLSRSGAYLVCANDDCPAQGVGRIVRWVEKLGIKDVGESFIQALWDANQVRDPSDLYLVSKLVARALTVSGSRVGRRADIALDNLHAQKELPLHVFVGALSIPLMARSMCKKVVDAGYDSLAAMSVATVDELASIPGMGQVKAQSLHDGLDEIKWLIGKLLNAGITIKAPSVGAFTGKSFCLTGVRDAALATRIESHGGAMKSSVGKTLTFLICKSPDGTSGKLKKARSLGVTLLSLEDAWDLAGGR